MTVEMTNGQAAAILSGGPCLTPGDYNTAKKIAVAAIEEAARLKGEVRELVAALHIQVIATVDVDSLVARPGHRFPAVEALVKHGEITRTGDRFRWRTDTK